LFFRSDFWYYNFSFQHIFYLVFGKHLNFNPYFQQHRGAYGGYYRATSIFQEPSFLGVILCPIFIASTNLFLQISKVTTLIKTLILLMGFLALLSLGSVIVKRFTEKPDFETAKKFVSEGDFYWNSGMSAFTIKTMAEELKLYAPEIYRLFNQTLDEILSSFHSIPDISIDYAIMEKPKRVVAIPMDIYWSDIGCWDSLYDVLEKDEKRNAIFGDVIAKDTEKFIDNRKQKVYSNGELAGFSSRAILIAKKVQPKGLNT